MNMKSIINKVFNNPALHISSLMMMVIAVLFTAIGCSNDFESPVTPEGSTIVEIATGDDDFDILVAALTQTGLASTLNNNNSGQFTVFAPVDAAFLTYLQGVYADPSLTEADAILKIQGLTNISTPLSIPTLVGRLNYHIISSEIKSSQITGFQTFTTLSTPSTSSGQARISLSIVGSDIFINATGAKVIAVDTDASNGVIHTIDKVLNPPSVASSLAQLGYTSSATVQPINYGTNPATINGGNTPDATDTDYDLFAIALRKTGLCFTVYPNKSPLPDYTIFAPRDLPFRTYLATLSASVTNEATAQTFINSFNGATTPTLDEFTNIIKYHIVTGRIVSTDLSNAQQVTTLLASKAITVNVAGSITVTDQNAGSSDAAIVSQDVLTNAGIVHGIDNVLLPN
jgi:transforming growth factor-beta-induced protein